MALTHDVEDESKVKVFEIYKNTQSYDVHRDSDQFKHYIETVGHVILKKEMVDLKVHFIVENARNRADDQERDIVELTKFEIGSNFESTLAEIKNELTEEIKSNDDLLSFYLMSDLNSSAYYIYKVARAKTEIAVFTKLEKDMNNIEITLLESDKVVSKGDFLYNRGSN